MWFVEDDPAARTGTLFVGTVDAAGAIDGFRLARGPGIGTPTHAAIGDVVYDYDEIDDIVWQQGHVFFVFDGARSMFWDSFRRESPRLAAEEWTLFAPTSRYGPDAEFLSLEVQADGGGRQWRRFGWASVGWIDLWRPVRETPVLSLPGRVLTGAFSGGGDTIIVLV